MGGQQSALLELAGFLEVGGGARLITLCGPTAAARLALTCEVLASARAPWASWEALQQGLAAFAAEAELELTASSSWSTASSSSSTGLLNPEALTAALPAAGHRDLLPEPQLLAAMCRICSAEGQGPTAADAAAALDELCIQLAYGADPRPLLLWARALRKPGLTSLLQRASAREATDNGPALEAAVTPCSVDEFYEDILKANVAGVVRHLATGIAPDVSGPRMLNSDPGCCRWSPLAAAAHNAGRMKNAACVVAVLLAARAKADAFCTGPCGWTALMRAAVSNAPDVCKVLVMAHADPRHRHTDGSTALDMAGKEAARAIREARELRNALRTPEADEVRTSSTGSAGRGRGRGGRAPNLAALGYAGRGKPLPKARK
eukprot:TRINITY_DN50628_c0_g1_i1.p1 TRINITY_DN50628_c0_g1~~TRINITY_DN50628_c0_g1_i1.p1  ORF type:complete len:384 (+),score=73.72 TRINITY_DN50628_c0_g1_i1:23-1153(+)